MLRPAILPPYRMKTLDRRKAVTAAVRKF